ncbi:MAG: glutaredoxin domain-containing protein [Planctomycetota bacterium]
MSSKRVFEVFSAGCGICTGAIEEIKNLACPSCEVRVLDMNDPAVAERAESLGIRSVPSVLVNGKLADCCAGRGIDIERLKELGLGKPC